MKVRILENTIRFRMSMTEIELLAQGKAVSSVTHFITESLMFVIKPSNSESNIDLNRNKITLEIENAPLLRLHQNNEEVGFRFTQGELNVLFEKDFKCLTNREEDESDLYTNPLSSH